MGSQFNIRDMPERARHQLSDLDEWAGYTQTQAVLIGIERLWLAVKQEREQKMQTHHKIKSQHDGNISFVISGMVAHVYQTERPIPENDTNWTAEDLKALKYGKREELFSSTNWEEAEEKYVEALMLRHQSGFKDAATIRQHLEQLSEQYG